MEEIWKTISYASNYEVSNFGNIKNKKTQKLRNLNIDRHKKDNKRVRPGLSHNGKIKAYYLHRIVAEHFIQNSNELPEVNHIDGDYYNNKADNLEWISKLDNMRHASENKLMKRYTRKVIITNKETGEEKLFDSVSNCSKFLDRSPGQIVNYIKGRYNHSIYSVKYDNDNKERLIDENENEDIIWKEYPECPKYLVSNTGEVKNKKTGRIMMGSKVNGYRFMTLFVDKDTPKINRLVHRIVAQTFFDNPDNKPVVNHKDTNILNNHVDNLEWVTYKENMNTKETIKNLKRGKNSKIIHQILIETGEIINTFYGGSDGHNKINIDESVILRICHFYNKGNEFVKDSSHQKTYQKEYIFIFDEDKDKIKEFLIIAERNGPSPKQLLKRKKVYQINKDTEEIINIFNSGCEASRELNIGKSGVSQCCQYYKYNDENRPKCYQIKTYKGFIFKQEFN